ncbi:phage tail protein, partial [Candidatus Pacearchaeota archaeon]|nr:phage tail protein [Candidatus Pacearchaeota archaeon]
MVAIREGRRKHNDILRVELENERSSFIGHWRDLGDNFLPRRTRFTTHDTNKGQGRNQKIINSTGALAARTLRSGMMAGITSPARPWFRLTIQDSALAEFGPVKIWLETVTNKLRAIFLKSNLYNSLSTIYGDLGVFGTGAIFMEEDFDDVVRFYSLPIGSYSIANDNKLKVKVFFREFRMTVRQIVMKFGQIGEDGKPNWENITGHVQQLWENGQREIWVDVCHVIKPNDNFDPKKLEAKFKRYSSVYWEKGSIGADVPTHSNEGDEDKLLRESGYSHFPVLAPRWETTGEDSYATSCPGMIALGDNKGLQNMEKRKAQAIEKMVNPAMTGPSSLRNTKVSILPGDTTFDDVREGQKGFRPAHEVNPKIAEMVVDIQNHERRIEKAYFVDLFLMLSTSDRREITAREIDERHEEKLLGLGPVLENVNQDLLDPLVENGLEFGFEQDIFPPPPEELAGADLKIEYISIMAQAQKLAGIASLERFVAFSMNLAKELKASEGVSLLDKLNFDQIIDVYADRMGVDADIVI